MGSRVILAVLSCFGACRGYYLRQMNAVTTSGVSVNGAGTGQAKVSIETGEGEARASGARELIGSSIELGERKTQGPLSSDAYGVIFAFSIGRWADFARMRRCCVAMYELGRNLFNARFRDTEALFKELEYCSDNGYRKRGKEFVLYLDALGVLEERKAEIAERLLLPFTGYEAVEVEICNSRKEFILELVNSESPLFKELDLDLLRVLSMKLEINCNIQKDFASIFLQSWEDKYCGEVLVADQVGCVQTWPKWIPVYAKMDPCENGSVFLVLSEMTHVWAPEGVFKRLAPRTIEITRRVLLDIVRKGSCPEDSIYLLRKMLKEYGKHCRFTQDECLAVADYLKKCEHITLKSRMQIMFYYGRGQPEVIKTLQPELLDLISRYPIADNLAEQTGILTGIAIGLIIRAITLEEVTEFISTRAAICLTNANEEIRLNMLDVLHGVYHIGREPREDIRALIEPTLVGLCQGEDSRSRRKTYETLICWSKHIQFKDETIRPIIAALGNDISGELGTIVSTALRCYGTMIENGIIKSEHYAFVKLIQSKLGDWMEGTSLHIKLQALWLLGVLIKNKVLLPEEVNIVTLEALTKYKAVLIQNDRIKYISNENLTSFLRMWMQLEPVCTGSETELLWKEIGRMYIEESFKRGLVMSGNEVDSD